jgi:hypothetical protein
MIHYSITHEIYTEEDAEIGEPSIAEFLSQSEYDDFRTMADLLQGTEPSQYPLIDSPNNVWFTEYGEMDFFTGEIENRSYHPATKYDERYMLKAWKYANQRNK